MITCMQDGIGQQGCRGGGRQQGRRPGGMITCSCAATMPVTTSTSQFPSIISDWLDTDVVARLLQLCKRLKDEGYTVIGTVRNASSQLEAAGVECITGDPTAANVGLCLPSPDPSWHHTDMVVMRRRFTFKPQGRVLVLLQGMTLQRATRCSCRMPSGTRQSTCWWWRLASRRSTRCRQRRGTSSCGSLRSTPSGPCSWCRRCCPGCSQAAR
jgi:hypothetical protein